MKNVVMQIDDHILTIRVDLSKQVGPSMSGKTMIIGTTSGNAPVEDSGEPPIVVGLNVYRKLVRSAT